MPAQFRIQNSQTEPGYYIVVDTYRRNAWGERYVVAFGLSYERALEIAQRLNREPQFRKSYGY